MSRQYVQKHGKRVPTGKKRYKKKSLSRYRQLNQRTAGYEGIELKFLDTELTAANVNVTWQTFNPTGTGCTDSLSVPAVGTGESERLGRRYCIKSILVRGYFSMPVAENTAAPFQDQFVRVIVYWDTQTNSAEATATDIMDGGLSNDWLAWRNLQNSRRFIVLYDKFMRIPSDNQMNEGAQNIFAIGGRLKSFKFYKNFKDGIEVTCDATTANVTSVSDNNIGVAAVASSTSVSLVYQSRIRFVG